MRTKCFGLPSFGWTAALLVAAWLASPAIAADAAPAGAAQRCAVLAAWTNDLGAIVRDANLVAEGPVQPQPTPGATAAPKLPQHCLIRGVINPRTGAGGRSFGIGFELRLPVAWNGRFLFQGGAGLDGQIAPAIGRVANSAEQPALAQGFAVVSTDSGHQGPIVDASFALDQQARVDYGYGALDKVTLVAKTLIARFYGKAPDRSYFVGCSNGGRQGFTAAQRLSGYFDGIVAGDPTIRFSRVAIDELWNLRVLARIAPKAADGKPVIARAFSPAHLDFVRKAVLEQCDALDGLSDGFINDWRRCAFDPGVLLCKGKSDECLSAQQVAALRDLHRGPRTASGKSIYGPFNYDTGIASSAWRGMRLGSATDGNSNSADATLGIGQLKYFQLTPPEPDFDPLAPVDYEDLVERVRYSAALADADSPFLSTFAGRGKLIVYNGLSDQGLASSELVEWYGQMERASGQPGRDAVRLFFVPGMLHCGGGEATDQFEMLDAITQWVEKGVPPDRIDAKSSQNRALSRPLCPFPAVARYRGGDVNQAASFQCVAPTN